jgi:hypothetical protein
MGRLMAVDFLWLLEVAQLGLNFTSGATYLTQLRRFSNHAKIVTENMAMGALNKQRMITLL